MEFITPTLKAKSFNCPFCGVISQQTWSAIFRIFFNDKQANGQTIQLFYDLQENFSTSKCKHCDEVALWKNKKMIYPLTGTVSTPNQDMPSDVKGDYLEAKDIVTLSPRGAAALLRLALQKLCIHLGESGKNVNDDIKNLVAKGLPITLQQALDSVRVIGNNAVHPGQLDLKDDIDTAYKLFGFLNIICDMLITQPKRIEEFYNLKIPANLKDAIDKWDGK